MGTLSEILGENFSPSGIEARYGLLGYAEAVAMHRNAVAVEYCPDTARSTALHELLADE